MKRYSRGQALAILIGVLDGDYQKAGEAVWGDMAPWADEAVIDRYTILGIPMLKMEFTSESGKSETAEVYIGGTSELFVYGIATSSGARFIGALPLEAQKRAAEIVFKNREELIRADEPWTINLITTAMRILAELQ